MEKQLKIFTCSLGGVVVGCVGPSAPPPLDKHLARGHHSDLAPVLFGGEVVPEQKTRRSISLPCGNRKEIITAAHLVFVGLGCESGGGPLGHQVRIALHETYMYTSTKRPT